MKETRRVSQGSRLWHAAVAYRKISERKEAGQRMDYLRPIRMGAFFKTFSTFWPLEWSWIVMLSTKRFVVE